MSRAGVAVVTDSTSSLTGEDIAGLGLQIVPLRVRLADPLDGDSTPGAELSGADVRTVMAAGKRVSTSRPSQQDFASAYERALTGGATSVISIHLSSELSGTCDAARVVAATFGERVRVLDSRTTAMGLGFAALRAAALADIGADGQTIEDAMCDFVRESRVLFYVNSLEWLRRSGRIGPAAAKWGGALSIKPLLHVADGDIVALEKVRTSAKAIDRLVELAVAETQGRDVEVAVQHLGDSARGAEVAALIRKKVSDATPIRVREVGPVIGAHVGPGLVGIAVTPA